MLTSNNTALIPQCTTAVHMQQQGQTQHTFQGTTQQPLYDNTAGNGHFAKYGKRVHSRRVKIHKALELENREIARSKHHDYELEAALVQGAVW